jgi:tetratricopeptide (TPR) repeat protein
VAVVYRQLAGGGSLFFETLLLLPPSALRDEEGWWKVAELDGDEVWVDGTTGIIWKCEADSGEWLEEGTSFDRWLAGFIDAEELLYERDGEFRDEVFDDAGELLPETVAARERAVLKRDRGAIAPRWRLARALAQLGELQTARDELEIALERAPQFSWGWYDLSRLAEKLGDSRAARDDMKAAAEADSAGGGGFAAFFWSHVARLAVADGDEPARAEAASRALAADNAIARTQLDGARDRFESGDLDAAEELGMIAAAVTPTDLAVLDLTRRIAREKALASESEGRESEDSPD